VIEKVADTYGEILFEADPLYACAPCQGKPPAELVTAADIADENKDTVVEVTNGKDGKKLKTAVVANATQVEANPEAILPSAVTATTPAAANAPLKTYRQAERIVKASAAFDMANILKDVIIHGTGRAALKLGRDDLGGKTGTTNDAKDAWFAGFNADLVTITWVGFDQPRTLGRREYGGVAALPIWIKYMGDALKDTPSRWVTLSKDAEEDSTEISNTDPNAPKIASKPRNSAPPMATALYKPKPLPVEVLDTFEDLPDMDPDEAPPAPNTAIPPKPAAPAASPQDIF
jgi:penicillin-binding protein 1A